MTGPQDDDVLVVPESSLDLVDESSEVFLSVSFQCTLGRACTTVTDLRSVTKMARRAMARRDVGFEVLQVGSDAGPPGDDGFASIDPDESDVAPAILAGPPGPRLPPAPDIARERTHARMPPNSDPSVVRGPRVVICRAQSDFMPNGLSACPSWPVSVVVLPPSAQRDRWIVTCA
jgi:hypothetical protein